ncbi:MAG: TaqI-like C-terminal specificity domain-containing protein, partial [Promethearchaeota archaeon]
KFIYNKTKIKEIYHTGPKFNDPIVSNIILILQKEENILERKKNQIKLKVLNIPEKIIPQEVIEKWDYKFLIYLNKTDISLIEHLKTNFPKLKDLNERNEFKFVLSRGVELTKTGEIIFCETCKKYTPVPKKILECHECNSLLNKQNIEKIIYDTLPDDAIKENYKLYLYSINRYDKTQYKYIDTSKIGIVYKDLSYYEDRIIIRQISQNNRICATYDKNLSLTSQSFYNLKIEKSYIPEFNNFYFLGILNSDLLSYYFIKSFGSYKKLFPRILIEKIKDFPIKIPNTDKEKEKAKKIGELVKKILKNIDEMENLQKKIDTLVFDLYRISDKDRKHIMNYLKTLN